MKHQTLKIKENECVKYLFIFQNKYLSFLLMGQKFIISGEKVKRQIAYEIK